MGSGRVLVACERNQFVAMAFRRKGIEAYSCDIQPCTGAHPEWHIQCDARQMLKLPWDLIIAHPPCTYLTCASAVRLYNADHTIKDYERLMRGMEAAEFFNLFLNANCERVVVENPKMMSIWGIRKPDQYIEPYQFGHKWKKKTGLWLKGVLDADAHKHSQTGGPVGRIKQRTEVGCVKFWNVPEFTKKF